MLLCKQTEHPNFILRIKIYSESIIESKVWPIIDFEKLGWFPPLMTTGYCQNSQRWFQHLQSECNSTYFWWYNFDHFVEEPKLSNLLVESLPTILYTWLQALKKMITLFTGAILIYFCCWQIIVHPDNLPAAPCIFINNLFSMN